MSVTGDSSLRANLEASISKHTHVIEARPGWRGIDFAELWRYRDLLYFLVWRDIKATYAQSVLGIAWALVQPVFFMIVFTVVFGQLARISSDDAPYAIFSYTALVPWTFFAGALTASSGSLVMNSAILTKVYFPRLVMPLAAPISKLLDFSIGLVLLVALMVWFRQTPTAWALSLPLVAALMFATTAGLGMMLSALAVQYRDVRHGLSIGVQIAMYLSPVVYPASLIPDRFRLLYGINPMTGVIEGFRSALLQTNPMPWDLLAVGSASAAVILVVGAFSFRRMERRFADVV